MTWPDEWVEDGTWHVLDDDHRYQFVTEDGHDGPSGIILAHRTEPRPFGGVHDPDEPGHVWCVGSVPFSTSRSHTVHGRAGWQVRSLDPLHLDPSILCRAPLYDPDPDSPSGYRRTDRTCDHHGHIHDGVWVPA